MNVFSKMHIKTTADSCYFLNLGVILVSLIDFQPSTQSLPLGLFFIVCASLLKFWLCAYPDPKNMNFAVYGPYRFVRFPSLLSSFLCGLGLGVLTGSLLAIVFLLIGFYLIYFKNSRSKDEERFKKTAYHYKYYQAQVSAFIPGLIPYPASTQRSGTWRNIFNNRRHPELSILGFVVIYIAYIIVFLNWSTLQASHNKLAMALILVPLFLAISKLRFKGLRYGKTTP